MLLISITSFGAASELTAEQSAKLQSVQSELKRATSNYNLALQSAGSGNSKPTGSKARLTKMRLDSAAVNLPNIKKKLLDLPQDNESVKSLKDSFDELEKRVSLLYERLEGKSSTEQKQSPSSNNNQTKSSIEPKQVKPAAETSPKSDTVKLGYQQEEKLKGAKFNLRQVEGNVNSINKQIATWKPIEDQLTISFREVYSSLENLKETKRKSGFVQDALNDLPKNGEGVADVDSRLQTVNKQISTANDYLSPLYSKLIKIIDPKNYPNLQTDLKRLREMSGMYANTMILQTNREQAAAVLKQSDATKKETIRLAQEYLRLIQQQTAEGKSIEGAGNSFLKNQANFIATAEREKPGLAAAIRNDIKQVNDIANEAVQNKKPLYFTGGIPQQMSFIEDKMILFKVLDVENAVALQKEIDGLKDSLKQRAASLSKQIIENNPLPNDRYTGGDRDRVIAVAVDAWKHQEKEFDLLMSRIPSEAWKRETLWQYSNGTWYFVDRSKLQVQLLVADKKDSSLAIIRPINIWKNHQKGDTLIGTPLDSIDDDLIPNDYLLKSKIK